MSKKVPLVTYKNDERIVVEEADAEEIDDNFHVTASRSYRGDMEEQVTPDVVINEVATGGF